MGLLDQSTAKVGSLVAAAMESAGIALQSDFLDFITGQGAAATDASGPLLAGLFYLLAVATGVLTVAIGGNYKWARYLLIGPPLFFFLTQVRISSNGTDWVFGDDTFPKDAKERALRGIKNFEQGKTGGSDVAMFFKFWNIFISDVTHTMVQQLNRNKDQRHYNFIAKIDRYMRFWNFSHIGDSDVRMLIHTVMVPKCSEYFALKRNLARAINDDPNIVRDKARLADIIDIPVEFFQDTNTQEENRFWQRLIDEGIVKGESMTCEQIWIGMVDHMRKKSMEERLKTHLQQGAGPGQDPNEIVKMLLLKFTTQTDPGLAQTKIEKGTGPGQIDEGKDPEGFEEEEEKTPSQKEQEEKESFSRKTTTGS